MNLSALDISGELFSEGDPNIRCVQVECPAPGYVVGADGWCGVCVPDCTGRDCGDDGCGGSCGTCGGNIECSPSGLCEDMIRIPGGTFDMGSVDYEDNEKPVTRVTLSPYYIDRLPVTVDEYSLCVDAGECEEPQTWTADHNWGVNGKGNHPINDVDWQDARDYCLWRGAALPTEAQWEFAARGTDGRVYPWGNQAPDDTRACWKALSEGTCEVGSYPAGSSPFGVLDMSGNVWEWVLDWYGDYPGGSVTDYTGPQSGTLRVLRGGSWYDLNPGRLRTSFRGWGQPDSRYAGYGFRCARGDS